MLPVLSWLERLPWVGRYAVLLFDRRSAVRTALARVAEELDFNAEPIDRHLSGQAGITSVQARIDLSQWERHRDTLHKGIARDKSLTAEESQLFAEIRRTKIHGAAPPSADRLRELAARLRAVRL